MAGDAWGCLTHLPPSTYVCSPSGFGQGQSRACSHRPPHLWVSPGRCGHSRGLCSCSSYPLGRDRQERGWGPGREREGENFRLQEPTEHHNRRESSEAAASTRGAHALHTQRAHLPIGGRALRGQTVPRPCSQSCTVGGREGPPRRLRGTVCGTALGSRLQTAPRCSRGVGGVHSAFQCAWGVPL